jgi:type VI secretion system protein ImpL
MQRLNGTRPTARHGKVWQPWGTERTLAGEAEWQAALDLVASAKSPYYQVMDRLDESSPVNLPCGCRAPSVVVSWLGQLRAGKSLSSVGEALKVVDAINTVGNKGDQGSAVRARLLLAEATLKNNLTA